MQRLIQRFFSPTAQLRLFGFAKIPLLLITWPRVVELNDDLIKIEMPLNYLTRNHLGSMYFGALAIGADCAAGLLTVHHINKSGHDIQLVFKNLTAEFLRRPDSRVRFVCREGQKLSGLVDLAARSTERHHETVRIEAFVREHLVATFGMTISLKRRVSTS